MFNKIKYHLSVFSHTKILLILLKLHGLKLIQSKVRINLYKHKFNHTCSMHNLVIVLVFDAVFLQVH